MGVLILIACIILNTYIGVVFKLFEKFGISNTQAIVVNYWICVITGILFSGVNPLAASYTSDSFFPWALFNGFAYFIIFVFIALSTVKNGVATTQVANKLSLVIPVIIIFLLYNEPLSILKILGIICALVAVVFTSYSGSQASKNNYLFPAIIFFGSGMLDFISSYVQRNFLTTTEKANAYLISCFGMAAICSTLYLIYFIIKGKEKLQFKNVIGGVLLGFPNYFSIYTLLKALDSNILKPTALIPVNNIGIVLVSSLVAILFFAEKVNKQKLIGIGLAIVAIALIILGD